MHFFKMLLLGLFTTAGAFQAGKISVLVLLAVQHSLKMFLSGFHDNQRLVTRRSSAERWFDSSAAAAHHCS